MLLGYPLGQIIPPSFPASLEEILTVQFMKSLFTL